MFTLALNPSVHPGLLYNFSSETVDYDMHDYLKSYLACSMEVCVSVCLSARGIMPAPEVTQAGGISRDRMLQPI